MKRKPSRMEQIFAKIAAQAAETDPVLSELDAVLDADPLSRQMGAQLDGLEEEATSGEVLLRLLLVKYLYTWSVQETVEQVEDSLVLRWFCRLEMRPVPPESLVIRAARQVPLTVLKELANRVERARERAKSSEGQLRPEFRQRWR
jgi:transposase, IS5 family